jgi:alpha-ketoglutarate-dependent taurine dioxygenase
MQHSWRRVGVAMPELDFMKPLARKLVRRHQPSGRDALVIPSHVERILGLSSEQSRTLMEELTALATTPERVYRHQWRAGDLLIWDNRCMLHRASRSGADDQPRDLRTCRLIDPDDDGLAARVEAARGEPQARSTCARTRPRASSQPFRPA